MFDRIGSKRRQALVGVALFVGSIWLVMSISKRWWRRWKAKTAVAGIVLGAGVLGFLLFQ